MALFNTFRMFQCQARHGFTGCTASVLLARASIFQTQCHSRRCYRLPERRFFSQRRVFAALQVIHKKEFSFKVLHSSGMSFYRKAHFNKMHAACTVAHSHGKMERPGFKKLQRPDLSHSMVLRLLQHLLL